MKAKKKAAKPLRKGKKLGGGRLQRASLQRASLQRSPGGSSPIPIPYPN